MTRDSLSYGDHVFKKRDILYLIGIILILNFAVSSLYKTSQDKSVKTEVTETSPAESDNSFVHQIITAVNLDINARSACVIDFDTGTILYEKNAYQKRPMASTTKIMTAIIALETCSLNDDVPISGKAAYMDGSTMGLKEGKTVKMKDLLYGLLLCSGNDAAVAIAEFCGGSKEAFAEMMNQKAIEIGAFETSFSNPHGLDAENHYTTAYDLAKIARYALKNPTFNQIVQTNDYLYEGRTLRSTNEMLQGYEGADGVKTGYTGLAGRCLVTSATRNNMRLISVVLFCDTKNMRTSSSRRILDYSFEHFGYVQLLKKGDVMGEIAVKRARQLKSIDVAVSDDVKAIIDHDKKDMLYTRVSMPEKLMAPIKKGSILGTVSVYQGERIIAEASLVSLSSAEVKTLKDYFEQVLYNWLQVIQ